MRAQASSTEALILYVWLKQAKTNAASGRPSAARGGGSAIGPLPVVGLVAARKADQRLGIVGRVRRGRDDRVAQQPVDPRRAHGAGVAQPLRLHRRRPQRHHVGRRAGGVALEVDQHVDAVGADLRREPADGPPARVDEAIEGADEPRPHRAAVVGAGRVRGDGHARAVVRLEHAGGQRRRRVLVEVGGQVAYPQRPRRIGRWQRRRRNRGRGQPRRPGFGAAALLRARRRRRQQRERR